MKKKISVIVWVIAICALLSAAYVFYSRNSQKVDATAQQNKTTDSSSQQSKSTANTAQQTKTGSSSQQSKETFKDFSLKDLNGKEYKLSDYKGKILMLTIWEVRCSYCKKEIPMLNELKKELENQKDVAILTICSAEKNETVQTYLTNNNITLDVALDPDAAVYYANGTKVIPNNFILKKDGSVYNHVAGPVTKDQILKWIDEIRKAETAK